MVGDIAKALAFTAVLSVASAAVYELPLVIKKPPVLVVPPAPVNLGASGPVPVIPPSDRTFIDPIRLPAKASRQFVPPSFGGSASASESFNFGGNVNIPGVGGFGISESASFGGGFGFGGSPGGG